MKWAALHRKSAMKKKALPHGSRSPASQVCRDSNGVKSAVVLASFHDPSHAIDFEQIFVHQQCSRIWLRLIFQLNVIADFSPSLRYDRRLGGFPGF